MTTPKSPRPSFRRTPPAANRTPVRHIQSKHRKAGVLRRKPKK